MRTDAVPPKSPFSDIKEDFDRDGFVILRGYASEAEVAELRDRAVPLAENRLARLHDTEHKKAVEYFRNVVKNLQADCPWFAEQLTAGRHVPLMKTLIGDELVPATAAWFDRPQGAPDTIEPHTDGGWRGHGAGVGATIWIALDAAGPDNGCLYYRRGSHLTQLTKGVFVDDFDTEKDAVAAEVAPGDAVIHSALTVHWSGPNLSNRPRRAVSFFYWGATHAAQFKSKEKRPWPK